MTWILRELEERLEPGHSKAWAESGSLRGLSGHLRNHVASEFLSLLAHSFLSEQVQKGKSSLKGKKGEEVFSRLLSVVDDGLFPKGAATSPWMPKGLPVKGPFWFFKEKFPVIFTTDTGPIGESIFFQGGFYREQ